MRVHIYKNNDQHKVDYRFIIFIDKTQVISRRKYGSKQAAYQAGYETIEKIESIVSGVKNEL